jgi:hypothetical protein
MSGVLGPIRDDTQMTEFSAGTYSRTPPAGCAYLSPRVVIDPWRSTGAVSQASSRSSAIRDNLVDRAVLTNFPATRTLEDPHSSA